MDLIERLLTTFSIDSTVFVFCKNDPEFFLEWADQFTSTLGRIPEAIGVA